MKKFAIIWDIITFILLFTIIGLKIAGILTLNWIWVLISIPVVIGLEFIISVVIKRKIYKI